MVSFEWHVMRLRTQYFGHSIEKNVTHPTVVLEQLSFYQSLHEETEARLGN